jgi:hypothetical protein
MESLPWQDWTQEASEEFGSDFRRKFGIGPAEREFHNAVPTLLSRQKPLGETVNLLYSSWGYSVL